MKRKLFALLLCLVFTGMALLPAAATQAGLPLVVDDAGLLTQTEIEELSAYASSLGSEYGMDIVILTVDSLGGRSAGGYADDYYDQNGYGVGPDHSGILLLLAMESREWYISTCGEARYAVPDREINELFNAMSGYLSNGSYYYAFCAYLNLLEAYLEDYEGYADSGGYNSDYSYSDSSGPLAFENLLIAIGIGLAVGGISLLIMRSMMNTKRSQRGASDYLERNTYHLKVQRDMFLYSRVHKVPKPKDNGGSRGGGGGGRSHGGGGGRF